MDPAPPAASPDASAGGRVSRTLAGSLDLVAAAILSLGAAVAVLAVPAGDPVRAALASGVLAVVPGYALMETVLPWPPTALKRLRHLVVALGVSPAMIGLAALATALVPGGFRAAPIVWTLTGLCLLLTGAAAARRWIPTSSGREPTPGPPNDGPSAFAAPRAQSPARGHR